MGDLNAALIAGPPPPLNPAIPLPAMVVITPIETFRTRVAVGYVEAARRVHGNAYRLAQFPPNRRPLSALLSATPSVPSPAIVVITPPDTLRTRWFSESAMYGLPAESTATPPA